LAGLVPRYSYEINVVMSTGDEGRPNSWRTVGHAAPARIGRIELGDLALPDSERQHTWKDDLEAAFARKEPIAQRLSDARHTATMSWQRVLVVIGSPERAQSRQFFEEWRDMEHPDVWEAMIEYVVLGINADASDPAARQWANEMKIAWPAKGMTLAILDMDGRLLVQTPADPLFVNGKLSRQKLIAFAKLHAIAKPDARALLDEALTRARHEGKNVLLEQSGPYCPWCVKLSDYLKANRALLDKDFVTVTIDRRFAHADKIIDDLRATHEDRGSTPWMAMLTPDSRVLMTSDAASGNIGFPSNPEGRAQWVKMLHAGAHRLTDADIQSLSENVNSPREQVN
jgi:hypothetical protein